MDNSVMGGGLLSSTTGGILELEPSIHRHQQHHLSHLPLSHHHHIQAMGTINGFENENSIGMLEHNGNGSKGISMNYGKGKGLTASDANTNTSDEDEPSFAEDGHKMHSDGTKGKKNSQWQRMKWTDNMVRLLITVVACVGEDGTPDSDGLKRKSGLLQKKGKWKTVSKIMMERGCCVSPQQCEDKFNDLNKRYKRLNEILGRGTTCRVVENPFLLDSMAHLSPKLKEDVRKILSSKHLFYKEMCAYHNGQRIPNSQEFDVRGYSVSSVRCSKENNTFEEEDDEENEDCDDDLDNEDGANVDEDADRVSDFGKRKKMNEDDNNFWSHSGLHSHLVAEVPSVLLDTTKSPLEQLEWIGNRTLQLQEQRVSFQVQAFELEKRQFKWQRFCSKKDRELERLRLENERMKLENERMALQVKQKELELNFKRSEAFTNSVAVGMDRLQGRDQIDLSRVQ